MSDEPRMTDEEIERAIDLGDYQSGYVAAMQLLAEVKRLRAERQPFRTLMDAALERGLAEGTVDTALIDLAERLGFKRPAPDYASLERRVLANFPEGYRQALRAFRTLEDHTFSRQLERIAAALTPPAEPEKP